MRRRLGRRTKWTGLFWEMLHYWRSLSVFLDEGGVFAWHAWAVVGLLSAIILLGLRSSIVEGVSSVARLSGLKPARSITMSFDTTGAWLFTIFFGRWRRRRRETLTSGEIGGRGAVIRVLGLEKRKNHCGDFSSSTALSSTYDMFNIARTAIQCNSHFNYNSSHFERVLINCMYTLIYVH